MKYLGYVFLLIFIVVSGYYLINGGVKSSPKPSPSNSTNQSPKEQKMTYFEQSEKEGSASAGSYAFPGILSSDKIQNKKAVIKTNQGTIEFTLYADKAPKSV